MLIDKWKQEADLYKKRRDEPMTSDRDWSIWNARWHRLLDCIYDAEQLLKN